MPVFKLHNRFLRRHCSVIAAIVLLFTANNTFASSENNVYAELGKEQHAYLLACISFIADNGPIFIDGEPRFEDKFNVWGLDRSKLHFFWVVVNGGYGGVYEYYMHFCINEYKNRFPTAGQLGLDTDLKATAFLFAPIIKKVDENLSGQCGIIIRDSNVDSATREACAYYIRDKR